MEVVTPEGEIVVANECQNQDLFWAMRGVGWPTNPIILTPWLTDRGRAVGEPLA